MNTVWLHIQVDVSKTALGKTQAKCTLITAALENRYETEIGFTVYREGNRTSTGFIPHTYQRHLLVARLYWILANFSDKTIVKKISGRVFMVIKAAMYDSRIWEHDTAYLQEKDWKYFEYLSLD